MNTEAKWIWKKQDSYKAYNQIIIAKKGFKAEGVESAELCIAVDGRYRLFVNHEWVCDGPARAWPHQYRYDVINVGQYLADGENVIEVLARYNGVGDFRSVAKQAGLLVSLVIMPEVGEESEVASDADWQVARAGQWLSNTPKICVQRGPWECYDARLESDLVYESAEELFGANDGPWKNLAASSVPLLTKTPRSFLKYAGANVVSCRDDINLCISGSRLVFPEAIEANMHTFVPFGIATVLEVEKGCVVRLKSESWRTDHFKVAIDGVTQESGRYELQPGKHLLLAFNRSTLNHDKDTTLRIAGAADVIFKNPLVADYENPWCFIRFNEYAFVGSDLDWQAWETTHPESAHKLKEYNDATDGLLKEINSHESFLDQLRNRSECMSAIRMFNEDSYWMFRDREVVCDGRNYVSNPEGLTGGGAGVAVVAPCDRGDVELVYDLGEQNCGYLSLELESDAGVVMDVFGVEFINKDGRIQHTSENRNGFRYITKQGSNRFVSFERRAFRYIFITVRNHNAPVSIANIKLFESIYPVERVAEFECSDSRLNEIWKISERTLKLCMEDVFVDCPAYEQTLWVGDARNEALYAYYIYGALDIAKRSMELGAESLEFFPMIASQVPSSWENIIPVWSFLWVIGIWDYYWYSLDAEFLESMWPSIVKNLEGAERHIDGNGLFSAPMWNLFDWADIDHDHEVVLHNSMFMVGAIDAALKVASAIGEDGRNKWLVDMRKQLCTGVSRLWDENRGGYPDSVHSGGSISDSMSQHTSFLSILYDIASPEIRPVAVENLINPPEGMVAIGSPFACQYLYEAMEKAGLQKKIVDSIYKNYRPMLEAGATTVWESFPGRPLDIDGPSRSHCHAWSSLPLYFLNRIVLGIRQTSPGCRSFEISPVIWDGIPWAHGSVATPHGFVGVSWEIKGRELKINCSAPECVEIGFKHNESHENYNVSCEISIL